MTSLRLDSQSPWVRLGGTVGVVSIVFALLIASSSSGMTEDEVGLTVAGTVVCLFLVLIGFLWIKFLKQQNL